MEKITLFLEKQAGKAAAGLAFFYFLFTFSLSWLKYHYFLYNGLDLAIFAQVIFNTSHGRLFQFTLHPQSYLGDHFSLFLLFLAALYYFFSSPLFLLFSQSLAIALAAWPLFLIANEFFSSFRYPRFLSLLAVFAFLFNPFLMEANLFEFHILPFALFFLFFLFYFYLRQQKKAYFLFLVFSLFLREDIALITGFFCLAPFLKIFSYRRPTFKDIKEIFQKEKFWILTPLLFSAGWLFFSFRLISHFSFSGHYKFLTYYQWLGHPRSFGELIKNVFFFLFQHPLLWLAHFYSLNNINFFLALAAPFLFLPFLGLEYFLLISGPIAQVFLSDFGGSNIVIQTHYVIPFIFGSSLAFLMGMKRFLKFSFPRHPLFSWLRIFQREKYLSLLIFCGGVIYFSFCLGPLGAVFSFSHFDSHFRKIGDYFLRQIPPRASVTSSLRFLPNLANRYQLYALNYGFLGKRQFSQKDYKLPPAKYCLVDFSDIISYQIHAKDMAYYRQFYAQGNKHLRDYFANYQLKKVFGTVAFFQRKPKARGWQKLVRVEKAKNISAPLCADNYLSLVKVKARESFSSPVEGRHYSFWWSLRKKPAELSFYALKLIIRDSHGKLLWQRDYPLVYGLYPPFLWQKGELIKIDYWFSWPRKFSSSAFQKEIEIFSWQKADLYLDHFGYIENKIEKKKVFCRLFLGKNAVKRVFSLAAN